MFKKIISNLVIIISIMLLVLIGLDSVNEAMGFLQGKEFETLLIFYVISSCTASILLFSSQRKLK